MSDIFISYASEDRERILPLVRALEKTGWSIFWDRTIPISKTWQQVIGEEIDHCRCMIVAWSSASVHSEWVYEEAGEGRRRHILFPVLIDDVLPPIGFRSVQAGDFVGWAGKQESTALEKLIKDISGIIGEPPADIEAKRKAGEEAEAKRKEEEEERRRAEEAKCNIEEEKRQKEEAKRKTEEARLQAETEAKRKADEERQRTEAEAKRKADEVRQRVRAEKGVAHGWEEREPLDRTVPTAGVRLHKLKIFALAAVAIALIIYIGLLARPLEQISKPDASAWMRLSLINAAKGVATYSDVNAGDEVMWALKDNGESVSWDEAHQYCRKLTLAEYSDWRLPTIEELDALYDSSRDATYKIRDSIDLSGCCPWSSTEQSADVHIFFNFLGGEHLDVKTMDPERVSAFSRSMRALCIRRSGG